MKKYVLLSVIIVAIAIACVLVFGNKNNETINNSDPGSHTISEDVGNNNEIEDNKEPTENPNENSTIVEDDNTSQIINTDTCPVTDDQTNDEDFEPYIIENDGEIEVIVPEGQGTDGM